MSGRGPCPLVLKEGTQSKNIVFILQFVGFFLLLLFSVFCLFLFLFCFAFLDKVSFTIQPGLVSTPCDLFASASQF